MSAGRPFEGSREDAILALVRGWVDCIGPFTVAELASTLVLPADDVLYALGQLENEGVVLRGSYRESGPSTSSGQAEIEFCDRRILARIHRSTIDSLRSQVEPVSPATFIRFLLDWQHVAPEARLHGEGGLLSVIEKLQGFETAAGVMEEEILGTRVTEYSGIMLDRLCLSGEVVWGRFSAQSNGNNGSPSKSGGNGRAAFSRFTPVTLALRESLDWLLPDEDVPTDGLTGAAQEALEYMRERGASFQSDIVAATRRLPSDVEEALWTLAASGLATADGLEALRQRLRGTKRPRRPSSSNRTRTDKVRRRSRFISDRGRGISDGVSRFRNTFPLPPGERQGGDVPAQLAAAGGSLRPRTRWKTEPRRWRGNCCTATGYCFPSCWPAIRCPFAGGTWRGFYAAWKRGARFGADGSCPASSASSSPCLKRQTRCAAGATGNRTTGWSLCRPAIR